MKQKYQKKPAEQRKLALEHIEQLMEQAKNAFKKDPKLSNRYVSMARKIAMKFKIRMPQHLKRMYCKHCHYFLMPGGNCRVRVSSGKVVYYCLNCKKFMRFPLKK
jgi:ribonuclease P protein subunit RPR2